MGFQLVGMAFPLVGMAFPLVGMAFSLGGMGKQQLARAGMVEKRSTYAEGVSASSPELAAQRTTLGQQDRVALFNLEGVEAPLTYRGRAALVARAAAMNLDDTPGAEAPSRHVDAPAGAPYIIGFHET